MILCHQRNKLYRERSIERFDSDSSGEGLESEPATLANFNPFPPLPSSIALRIRSLRVKAWPGTIYRYWTRPIRNTNYSALCNGVARESTPIPLNHAFIVPGGCFREICEYLYPPTSDTRLTYDSQTTGILSGPSNALSSPNSTASSAPPSKTNCSGSGSSPTADVSTTWTSLNYPYPFTCSTDTSTLQTVQERAVPWQTLNSSSGQRTGPPPSLALTPPGRTTCSITPSTTALPVQSRILRTTRPRGA